LAAATEEIPKSDPTIDKPASPKVDFKVREGIKLQLTSKDKSASKTRYKLREPKSIN
jgi:hypothetical protein